MSGEGGRGGGGGGGRRDDGGGRDRYGPPFAPTDPKVAPEVVSERRGTESKRLFVGARVSVATANALAGAAETLARRARDARQDWRFVAPASYHVTLAFLGWTRVEAIPAVEAAVGAAVAGTGRISFRVARIGAFASIERANVVWAGLEAGGAEAVSAVAEKVAAACEGLGFPREGRPFHPHVTLARLRDLASVKEVVLPLSEQMFGESRIHEVVLYESTTKSSGSVYSEVAVFPLSAAETPSISTPERQTPPLEPGVPDDTDDGWPRGHS